MPPSTIPIFMESLPNPVDQLVGRDSDKAAVETLLKQENIRLLTLTGPGGVGKTRLGLAVATAVRDGFPDGVVLVELATVPGDELVPTAIAQALRIGDAGLRTVGDHLTSALKAKCCLLLLDNFEHVIASAPLVSHLLAACPCLKVLVTSRRVLSIKGEHEYQVPPLARPDLNNAHNPEELAQVAAVDLFIQRAQAVRRDLQLSSTNAPAIAEICTQLDGLPLAIELAAARAKTLSPAALLARLSGRLGLLTTAGRDTPDRQQTLNKAITWSFDLLTPAEQQVFCRLSVFAGGFSLEAAEGVLSYGSGTSDPVNVGTDEALSQADDVSVLDSITSLVDQSLLRQEETAEGEIRFYMLETIRTYGRERLDASDDGENMRRAHAMYFLRFAERHAEDLQNSNQVVWLKRFDLEHANLRAALAWALQSDSSLGLSLASVLWWFWYGHGHLQEGRAWLRRALARSQDASRATRAAALHGAAVLAFAQGDSQQATKLNDGSLRLWSEIDDRSGVAKSQHLFGLMAETQRNFERATEYYQIALETFRSLGDNLWVSQEHNRLGVVAHAQHDNAEAMYQLLAALHLQRQLGNTWAVALTLETLAEVVGEEGELDRADQIYRESVALWAELGNVWGCAAALAGLAAVRANLGAAEQASRLCGAAEAFCESIAMPLLHTGIPNCQHAITISRAQLGEPACAAAVTAGRLLSLEQVLAEVATAENTTEHPPIGTIAHSATEVWPPLTVREREVLQRVAAGETDLQISAALFISPRTVANHVASIRTKLGVPTRAAAVALASRHRLI